MTTMLPALNLIIFGDFFKREGWYKSFFQPAGGFHCLLRFQAPSPAKSVSMYPFNVVGGCGRTIECKLTPVANVSSILMDVSISIEETFATGIHAGIHGYTLCRRWSLKPELTMEATSRLEKAFAPTLSLEKSYQR